MTPCPPIDLTCIPRRAVRNAAGGYLDEIAEAASEAAAEMLTTLVAGWLRVDRPAISETDGVVANLRSYTHWAVLAVAVGALLVGAIRLAIERNGREAGSIAKGLVALVVITGVGVPAVQVLTVVGDSYANWILTEAANKDLGARLLQLSPAAGASTLSPILLIGVSLFIFMAAMVQLMMLLVQHRVILSGVRTR